MLNGILLMVAAITAVVAVGAFAELVIGGRHLPSLRDHAPLDQGPRVSIIFAARDEGAGVEAAVRSHLGQQYGDLEVIAIDDRSVDETGTILDRVAREDRRLHVLHIDRLPDGWLGKNHALHRGAEAATGEYLLFTDGDVVFQPDTIGRAVSLMRARGADHLTLGPGLDVPTAPLALVVNFFTLWFLLYFKPWQAMRPISRKHLGIGAFNMVRAELYRRFGGHQPIAMRPDDDMKLGKLVKLAGGNQVVGAGSDAITVEWYATLGQLIRGLRKNAFAGLNYSMPLVVAAVVAQLLLNVWPFVAVAVTEGAVMWLNLVAAAALMLMYALMGWFSGSRPWLAVFYPVAALIFAYILVASTWRTVRRGGIEWRGTFYTLSELRRNVV